MARWPAATRSIRVVDDRLLGDLVHTSPRRVWALARLAIQESLRRNVLVALGVFVVMLLFAGWFLDPRRPNEPSSFDPGART